MELVHFNRKTSPHPRRCLKVILDQTFTNIHAAPVLRLIHKTCWDIWGFCPKFSPAFGFCFLILPAHLVIIWRPGSCAYVCLSVFFPWRCTAPLLVQAQCQSIRFHSACVCFSDWLGRNQETPHSHPYTSFSVSEKKRPFLLCQSTQRTMDWFDSFFCPFPLCSNSLHTWK